MPAVQAVKSVEAVMGHLKKKGSAKTRLIYSRHGMPLERTLGVNVADLKSVSKTIRGDQSLALRLYETGVMEAMYLAGMIADGSRMSREQLEDWCHGAIGLRMISEYTVPWVAVESALARDLAIEWIRSKNEYVVTTGWSTYAGLLATKSDDALDLAEVTDLLGAVVRGIGSAQNRVRYAMNQFVIATASYVTPLLKQAKAAAKQIGDVSVDMGDTSCKVPQATAYIAKMEAAGRVGRKRKTIRC